MNVNESDFQKRLDEIGKWYEEGKDAVHSTDDFMRHSEETSKILECLFNLRNIAAVAVKQAYQIKEN